MSHITKEEYLSAFVDGEAGSFEQHRICDQLSSDDAMREKLSSFALIGESIRNQSQSSASVAGPSFLIGIKEALDNEDPLNIIPEADTVNEPSTIRAKNKRSMPKQAFGYAIAASVAAVAAISFQNYNNSPSDNATQQASVMALASDKVRPSNVFKAPDAKTRGLMNKYVAHHLQYASSSTLMPRVRAVSYKTDF